jgi:hypothetical protein
MGKKNSTSFKPGQSGNPSGKKPIILPEVQRAIEANKNAMKVLIMTSLEDKAGQWIGNIIDAGIANGDAQSFKALVEMALGKMVEDTPDFPLTDEEKLLVTEFRRRKLERSVG